MINTFWVFVVLCIILLFLKRIRRLLNTHQRSIRVISSNKVVVTRNPFFCSTHAFLPSYLIVWSIHSPSYPTHPFVEMLLRFCLERRKSRCEKISTLLVVVLHDNGQRHQISSRLLRYPELTPQLGSTGVQSLAKMV
jgi:hypothetical protein